MKILLVHPSALLYAEVYLRLEPLGMECVGAAARAAGHEVRLLDLQVFPQSQFERELREYRPDVVGFSLNYLANAPEVIDLAKVIKALLRAISAAFSADNGTTSRRRVCPSLEPGLFRELLTSRCGAPPSAREIMSTVRLTGSNADKRTSPGLP